MDDVKNELTIAAIDANRLILTSRRVLYRAGQNYRSVRLENISFMELSKKRIPAILYISMIIDVFLPFFFNKDEEGLEDALKLAALIFVLAIAVYLVFQRRNLVIASAGGNIQVKATHIKYDECFRFIEYTENAIHNIKVNHASSAAVHI
jgi:hypothetical protein